MGLLQKACETYDCHIRLVGLPQAGEKKETLAPVSHILTCTDRDYSKPGWEISKC